MSRSSGGFLSALFDIFSSLFGRKPAAPPGPAFPPDSNDEPAQIVTSRVLVVVYDPVMDPATGRKLSETQGWHRTEDLATRFMTDILETSGGLARYQIVYGSLGAIVAQPDRSSNAAARFSLRGASTPAWR